MWRTLKSDLRQRLRVLRGESFVGREPSVSRILLANSKARQVRGYNGAANDVITRAKTEVLVFSRSTPANQSATRSKLIAAAGAKETEKAGR